MTDFKLILDKEHKIKRIYKISVIITIVLTIFAVCFVNYLLKIERKASELYLQQSVLQTASNIKNRINNDINDMEILSAMLSANTSSFSKEDIYNFISSNVTNSKYHRLSFAYPDGSAIRYEKKAGGLPPINWKDESCFDIAISGQPCFAETIESKNSKSGFVNRYFVPVFNKKNKIVGVLGSHNDTDIFKRILNLNTYDGKGFSQVIDLDGNYIIKSKNNENSYSNFFNLNIKLIGLTKEQLKNDFQTKKSGTFRFRKGNTVYIAAFATIEHNNCFILTDIPQDVLMHHINTLLSFIFLIIVILAFMLLALLKYTNKLNKNNEKAIYKIAFIDEVTENINKNKFLIDAKEKLKNAKENENYAALSMDITKFKVINELYGYKRANKILKEVYGIIKIFLPKDSICCRDFAATYVILLKYNNQNEIIEFIDKVNEGIKKYNEGIMQNLKTSTENRLVSMLSVIFGIYLINDKTIPISQMCDRASMAKRSITNQSLQKYQFYNDNFRAQILKDKAIEDEMNYALENNQFQMYLQPKFSLKDNKLKGAEALVRWIHPTKGLIPPGDFIPLFEKNGFIIDLDKCIWQQACKFLSKRKEEGKFLFPISINVSRLHLNNDAFIDELVKLVNDAEIDTRYIELELTESACLNNEKHFITIINKLKEHGFMISMDDFGTGYSSLNMLRHLPVDILKLDRGFITDTIMEEKGQIVVKTILDMANKLNMITVAEGVETQEQAAFLKASGCKIVQGYLYGRPMDINQFTKNFLNDDVKTNISEQN